MSGIKTGVTGSGRDRAHKRQGAAMPGRGPGMTAGAAGRRKPGRGNGAAATLAPVTVQGDGVGVTEGSGSYTAPSVGVGGKLPLSLREIPQSVSVITRQRIEDQNMGSLEDAMAQTPGITIDLAATAAIPQFYSRGFQIEYFQYDGVPMQTAARRGRSPTCSCTTTSSCCAARPACSTARASPAA